VNTDHVQVVPDLATGTAIISVDASGQNSIVLSPGGNGRVDATDLDRLSFSDYKLLLLQLEIPVEAVLAAARRAKESGLRVLLNPAPARELPDELTSLADILVPNETELRLLTSVSVTDIASAEEAARRLLERGPQNVIVTLGANGALIVSTQGAQYIPPFKVEAVDTTAAGDAFIGGFASALLQDQSIEEAVRYGCACGALAATKFGAQPSLPTKAEVEKLLAQSPVTHS
jgi:ribokinase